MNDTKPYVICHMMSTIDGKITSGTGVDILEEYFDLYTKTEDQLQGDAWMCGRITMEMFAKGEKSVLPPAPAAPVKADFADFISEKSSAGYLVGIDTRGVLRWKTNKVKLSNVPKEFPVITIVTGETPRAYLAYLKQMRINYIFGGDSKVDFNTVLAKLGNDFRVKRLLLEGGGKINGSVMEADLIDELSLLIAPVVLNRSAAPTIFEGITEKISLKKFALKEAITVEKDCVWLRYLRSR